MISSKEFEIMNPEYPGARAVLTGGLAATIVLTVLMYTAPLAGFPAIDMASAIGGFLGHPALLFTSRWWAGMIVFLLVGIVFSPMLFIGMARILYGGGWLRGLEWGVLLWSAGAVCVMVHLGLAFHPPFTTHPLLSALSSFLGNSIYGAVLGAVSMPPAILRQHALPSATA
jgi:hypothetical protein